MTLTSKERVIKLVEFLSKLYSEFITDEEAYLHFRFLYKEKAKSKWYKIGDWDKLRNSLTQIYSKQEKEKDPEVILILYNPVKNKEKTPYVVQYLVFDIDTPLTDQELQKIKELKPHVIISSGKGYHVIFKLEKQISTNEANKYLNVVLKKLKDILPHAKIEHYNIKDTYRAPYSLNLKYDPPIVVEPVEIIEENVLSLEELKKEFDALMTEKVEREISKWEVKITKRKLNDKDLPESVKEKIKELIRNFNLIHTGFSHYPLLFISSILIKAGYKFNQIKDFIYELANEFRTKDKPETRVKDTIENLISQIETLKAKDVNEMKDTILQKLKNLEECKGLKISEKVKEKIENTNDIDTLLYLYVKLIFPGLNFLKTLLEENNISDEQYKAFLKMYRLVLKKTKILEDGDYPIQKINNANDVTITYKRGLVYRKIYLTEAIRYEYIFPRRFRIYVTDAKEVIYKSDRFYILTVAFRDVKTKRTTFYQGNIEYILDKLSKYVLNPDKDKRHLRYLFLHAKFRKDKGYDKIGLVYDEVKQQFIPTYFGYEKYANVKYLLNEQQLSFLETYDDLEALIRKLKKKQDLESVKLSLAYLKKFFDLASDDNDYWLNTVLLFGYLVGSIALTSVAQYLGTVYPFLFLYDNGIGGTGKSTSLQIFAKILFGIRNLESIEIVKSLPRLRTYSSIFNIPIIIDEINEKSIKEEDVLTFIRAIATGIARSMRLKGTKEVEFFEVKAPFIFCGNVNVNECLPDVASSDRFILLEYKTRFRETNKYIYIKNKSEIDILRTKILSNPKITLAHVIFDDIASILNKKYKLDDIINEINALSIRLGNILNTTKRIGLAIILFGLKLWNEIMEMYAFDEKPIFNIDEIIKKIKEKFTKEEKRYDPEFENIMKKLSLALIYGILPYYDPKVKEDFERKVEQQTITEIIIGNNKYEGMYYQINLDLFSIIFGKDGINRKSFNKFKKFIYERVRHYNLASDGEVLYLENRRFHSIKRKDIDKYEEIKDIRNVLYIEKKVFERFLEGEEVINFPEIDYFSAVSLPVNNECPICSTMFNPNDKIIYIVDKLYHKDCVIKEIDKVVNEYKKKLGFDNKTNDEVLDYIISISYENLLNVKKEAQQEKDKQKETKQEEQHKETKPNEDKKYKESRSSQEQHDLRDQQGSQEPQEPHEHEDKHEPQEAKETLEDLGIQIEKEEETEANIEDVFPGLKEADFNEK